MIYLSLFLLLISGISKSIQDTSASNFYNSKLKKLNPLFWCKSESAKNKWKNGDKSQGERFWGSSTIFVGFTDAWHLFDFIRDITLIISLLLYPTLFLFISSWIIRQIFFEISYKYLNNDFDSILKKLNIIK